MKSKEEVPGKTKRSRLTDSAIGQLACAKYDSRRLAITKSEIPAAIVVCDARAGDSAEMFLLNKTGSEGL